MNWTSRAGRWLLALAVALFAGCSGGPGDRDGGYSSSITDCLSPAQARSRDVRRNLGRLHGEPICYRREEVREGGFTWIFHILEHRKAPDGPFWVLPHDNENTAFDAAVYAVGRYGGGLLAVDSGGLRNYRGQDPNRNFSSTAGESRLCIGQRRPAPGYTSHILAHYRGRSGPYLALHNNHNGWAGNGGHGTISLYREKSSLRAFPGTGGPAGLRDEDNLIFVAGRQSVAADPAMRRRIEALNAAGLDVVHKRVDRRSFDCSFSDYVARRRLGEYYNIEAEYGAASTQREMVDRLMGTLGIVALRQRPTNLFLE